MTEQEKATEAAAQDIMTAIRHLLEADGITAKDAARVVETALHDAILLAKLDGVIDENVGV